MRYSERVVLSWRETTDDPFQTEGVWVDVQDEGTASFAADAGITRADAYVLTMRYHSMPEAMRNLLFSVTQRAVLGDFFLAKCEVRNRGELLITSIVQSDARRRELSITCTSRQP